MDQNSVDALLQQVQSQADKVSQQAGDAPAAPNAAAPAAAEAIAALDQTTAAMNEIAGEMEGLPGAADHPAGDAHLAGEFAPPLTAAPTQGSIDARTLLAIEVPLIVHLGTRRMAVGEVMRLAVGAIVEFNKSADEDLELLVNNQPIGKGQAVKVGENFGIKITTIGSIKDTIRKLGGA